MSVLKFVLREKKKIIKSARVFVSVVYKKNFRCFYQENKNFCLKKI